MKYIVRSLFVLFLCFALLRTVTAEIYKIYIDPGHYRGDDRESHEIKTNLAVGLKLRALLERDPFPDVTFKVNMSREGPDSKKIGTEKSSYTLDLDQPRHRAQNANDFKADLFISIHCNGGENTGTETFWCDESSGLEGGDFRFPTSFTSKEAKVIADSRRFADLVQKHMAHHGDWYSRHGGKGLLDRTYPHFQKVYSSFGGHLPILLRLNVPGCLSEIGFVDNPDDLPKLLSEYWRNRFAEAYRDAIYDFFSLMRPQYRRIDLEPGWSIISIPGIPANSDPALLIMKEAEKMPSIVGYWDFNERELLPIHTLEIGKGYWVFSLSRDTLLLSYFPKYVHTISLEKGFNMIGSISHTTSFADAVRSANEEDGIKKIDEGLWAWNAEQKKLELLNPATIEPGMGYVVQAYRDADIIISFVPPLVPVPAPSQTPIETKLLANFPNPFNPETWIPFTLKEAGGVTVSIHAVSGHLVRTLDLGHLRSGFYATKDTAAYWDGRNAQGDKVASGVYFYTLETDAVSYTRKMLLLK